MASAAKTTSARTCLVTGGAGGLGKSIALALLAEGANVVVTDFNEKTLNSVTAEFQQRKESVLFLPADVSDAGAVESLISKTVQHFGQLDVLVNCAGIFDRLEPVGEISPELWSKVLTVNVTGPYLLSKAAINHFLSRSATDASIINIGSLASEHGWCGGAAYTTSKHAVRGLTKSIAAFYRNKGIRCNLVMPGGMNTDIVTNMANTQGLHQEGSKMLDAVVEALETPISDTKEVANLVVFLASTRSSALTGAVIKADHGITALI
ncbi:Bacilysin biosynthesis oxido BacC [Cyphellophora attinorum]|uniref:Bacilysin biosynthesis oxido BacC n=1 Tax=Cyphellophora attinorum TaxID=1664694 RepID=A0A0N1HNQ0_9EURO|nr:Bacilysin biosynthesis oxido BacC [Phialophora attinorum]KPI36732.1 Bacilysin biosynthesis oxido BacC [Phialophora attinorum]